MKKILPLTLLALTITLSGCGANTTDNANATATPTATASASATETPTSTPTAPTSVEPSRDANNPNLAQGNDYATGMNGVTETTPGKITTVTGDITPHSVENETAESPVTPNPEHTKPATSEDKSKLQEIIKNLDGSPVISAGNYDIRPNLKYPIKPADSKQQNGELSADKYAEVVVLDDVADGGEEYAIVAPQVKGNINDIKQNGFRPINTEAAKQALQNDHNTRIQGFLHYEPNATYTGQKTLTLHIKQSNHGAYAKAGAVATGESVAE